MGWYDRYVLPKLIDAACSQKPMQALRGRYVPRASGAVLEIGIGSGLNLPFYGSAVSSITGLDPAAELTSKARERAADLQRPVHVLGVSGEEIPADDQRFDTLVCTWTLCSIPNVYAALREMHRVLKPGGRLYFIEHGRAPDPGVVKWQHRLEPLWKKIGGGCHLTRQADTLIQDAGFRIEELDSGYEPGPRFAAFMTHGVAERPR
ncbi:MAG: class I SAM-dependent methyltransferase [Gammaproteobacteria bacterium]|nr:class I SAM-dependent methyltransferase [Gammaproteobacteria bacterium]